ncbi:hypothetical protein SAMD00019534_039710 [Acytostelium subglobosum LB1]|uniref:hypothetical protein n=1 Tax=Acytostelium subglobosum LB1 TaxID=1410327 RepID=UPI000644B559|nr:hypothetical protein SAMD00019534_039710 [Acytostelium subglobosum LB1]GAM20796.1 hypothetical protein SAMD00019534_039710 [Acytostelium subglobosum LB1]|eukprot:XP_012755930.1 hypothetical protein SAMD00019534_039710 [Acytostelium subglobosum LB1]
MDALPVIILRHLISFLDSNVDRLMLSLICKRIHKWHTITLHTEPSDESYSHSSPNLDFYAGNDIVYEDDRREELFNKVLAVPNIESVHFEDCAEDVLDETLWSAMGDLLTSLQSRGVTQLSLKTFTSEPFVFPSQLTSISLAGFFGSSLNGLFPTGLKTLMLGLCFGHTISPGDLPPHLETLDIMSGTLFTFQPGVFPNTLRSLSFCSNMPIIPGTLPPALRHLTIGAGFDQPLDDGVLPQSLTSLRFESHYTGNLLGGMMFSHPLTNLPPSLTDLKLPNVYSHVVDHQPLQSLSMWSDYQKVLCKSDVKYPNLTKLMVYDVLDNLLGVTSKHFPALLILETTRDRQSLNIHHDLSMDLSCLPSGLEHIAMRVPSTLQILSFPPNLTSMVVAIDHKGVFKLSAGLLPNSITSLTLIGYGHPFEQGHLPQSLTKLSIPEHSIDLDPKVLPTTLRHLIWTTGYTRQFYDFLMVFPASIQRFELSFNSKIVNLLRINDTTFFRYHNEDLTECGFTSITSITNQLKQLNSDSFIH